MTDARKLELRLRRNAARPVRGGRPQPSTSALDALVASLGRVVGVMHAMTVGYIQHDERLAAIEAVIKPRRRPRKGTSRARR